jgi:hypothetical protein
VPRILRNLRIQEGSLVDEPANKRARVVLFKRDGGGASGETTEMQYDILKFSDAEFRGGCRHCGYGDKQDIKKQSRCPFCWNSPR